MISWNDEYPDPPQGMTKMRVSSSLSLYREVTPNNWVSKDNDNQDYELTEEGFKYDDFWLHVLEDANYQPGWNYRLDI